MCQQGHAAEAITRPSLSRVATVYARPTVTTRRPKPSHQLGLVSCMGYEVTLR